MKVNFVLFLLFTGLNYVKAQNQAEEIFKVVEQMPRFPGCDGDSDFDNRQCTDKKLEAYIAKNLVYPDSALLMKIEGKVIIQFVVEEDGSIKEVKPVKDIGYGCGVAASKVILSMNDLPTKWIPSKQRHRNVRVLYTLPIAFKLPKNKQK